MADDTKFYVHYTVLDPKHPDGQHTDVHVRRIVLGPYSAGDAVTKRIEIASYGYVVNCFISEEGMPMP